jgi:zinc transport system substrate-binding protein
MSAVAGCLGGVTGGSAGEAADAQATFFVFGDFTSNVADETAAAETLVPTGQHGHGWEPGPRVREDIREAQLLVHGMEGFQPWVDDVLQDLDADGGDVTAVDISSGLDLLEAGGDHGHADNDHHEGETDHSEEEHHDEETHEEGDNHDGEADHSEEEHHDEETHQEDDHSEEETHEEEDHSEDDDHDHGSMDPHFWLDPLRAKEAVSTVRGGLVDIDPDNADAYADNAAAYREELDALHEELSSLVADAEKETILLAGHDAFQYLGSRYGIRFESLTGVSPDDQPTARDIERAQQVIDEHDIEYVCADPLESQTAAEQLVEDTDATEVLPLTSMPGLTDEWDEQGWGYLEVMENVNLPTLERALGV